MTVIQFELNHQRYSIHKNPAVSALTLATQQICCQKHKL